MSALNSTDIFVFISDYSEYSDYSDYSEKLRNLRFLRIPKSRYFSEK